MLKRPPLSSHLLFLPGLRRSTKVALSSAEAVLSLPNLSYVPRHAQLSQMQPVCAKVRLDFFTVPEAILKKFALFVTCHSPDIYTASVVNTSTRSFCSSTVLTSTLSAL